MRNRQTETGGGGGGGGDRGNIETEIMYLKGMLGV